MTNTTSEIPAQYSDKRTIACAVAIDNGEHFYELFIHLVNGCLIQLSFVKMANAVISSKVSLWIDGRNVIEWQDTRESPAANLKDFIDFAELGCLCVGERRRSVLAGQLALHRLVCDRAVSQTGNRQRACLAETDGVATPSRFRLRQRPQFEAPPEDPLGDPAYNATAGKNAAVEAAAASCPHDFGVAFAALGGAGQSTLG